MKINLPKHIFLFGHRKQHGKDTCCNIAEEYYDANNLSYKRTSFAKKLKLMAADEYSLDARYMDIEDYKKSKPLHLNGKSVRDILVEIGCREREKDQLFWARTAFEEILDSKAYIGLVSDFRFENEANKAPEITKAFIQKKYGNIAVEFVMPKIHKVLVYRTDGMFVSDGADDQLPDLDDENGKSFWDHVIMNDNNTESWRESLKTKVVNLVANNK